MVSPRKSSSALSLIPEDSYKMVPPTAKSCESLYSTSSSKGSAMANYRRRQTGGNAHNGGGRLATLIPATTEVRQRVLSARRLRMKTFQNQLVDAQQTIAELVHENRILRTLHKRQDSALAKYESTNAELPQLLHSHAEELRVWQTKYRNLQAANKDLEHKLKTKEATILSLSDQNKYYSQLNKDKNLEERQRLTDKLHALETRLQEKENDLKLLARRVQIEAKNFKQQLLTEQKRTKAANLKLEKARMELAAYRKMDDFSVDMPDKFPGMGGMRHKTAAEFESELDKDLDTLLEAHEDEEDDSMTSVKESHRSIKSTALSKLDLNSTRTIRKMRTQPLPPPPAMTNSIRSRIRGGGGSGAISAGGRSNVSNELSSRKDVKKSTARENISHNTTQESQSTKSDDYEDDYENGGADAETNPDDDPNVDNDGEQAPGEGENFSYEDDEQRAVDDRKDIIDEFEDDETLGDEDDADAADVILNASKSSARMKKDISSIRKSIASDYRDREAFLDTFCRQATNGVLHDETPKKLNSTVLAEKLPSSRKNKLLAALKAIDDNKSQD